MSAETTIPADFPPLVQAAEEAAREQWDAHVDVCSYGLACPQELGKGDVRVGDRGLHLGLSSPGSAGSCRVSVATRTSSPSRTSAAKASGL